MPGKEFVFKLNLSEEQSREIGLYISSLPPSDLLFALRFAYSRYAAESGGFDAWAKESGEKGNALAHRGPSKLAA